MHVQLSNKVGMTPNGKPAAKKYQLTGSSVIDQLAGSLQRSQPQPKKSFPQNKAQSYLHEVDRVLRDSWSQHAYNMQSSKPGAAKVITVMSDGPA